MHVRTELLISDFEGRLSLFVVMCLTGLLPSETKFMGKVKHITER